MPETEAKLEKSTTKISFGCVKCLKKMESIKIGASSGGGIFGLENTVVKALYCDNKKCDRFGLLTVAGLRTEE